MDNQDDAVVKILIEMGLNDAAAKKAVDSIKELGKTAEETGAQMDTIPESLQGLKKGEEELQDPTDKLNAGHREMRRALGELNKIFPGLGEVARLAGEGFESMSESELGAAAATEALIESLGPIAIVILSIQAATEYWDMYQDSVKSAAAAQAEASKQMVKDTQDALDAWQNYQDVISGKKESATKPYEQELERLKAIQEATNQGAGQLLAAQKKSALESATTPEQKQQVEKDYYQKEAALKEKQENVSQDNLNKVLDEIQKDMIGRRNKVESDVADQKEILARDPRLLIPSDREDYNKDAAEVKKQTDAIEKLQDLFEDYTEQLKNMQAVQGVHQQSAKNVSAVQTTSASDTTVSNAVSAYSAAQSGQKLSELQKQQIQDLTNFYGLMFGNTDLLKEALTYAHHHALSQQAEIALIKQQIQNMTNNRQ